MVAMPFPLSVKLSPDGNVPAVAVSDAAGKPVVVTSKVVPSVVVKVAASALVMLGASSLVRTKLCEVEPAALVAVIVTG
jgi:hypothetical protein